MTEPIDAYQQYIATKRAGEAATRGLASERHSSHPPTFALERACDEGPLLWWQWLIRFPVALVTSIGIIGIPYLFSPAKTCLTRKEADAENYRLMSGGGAIRVSIAPQQIEQIRTLVADELQRAARN